MKNYTIKAKFDNFLRYPHAFLFEEADSVENCEIRTINLPMLEVTLPPKYNEGIIAAYLGSESFEDWDEDGETSTIALIDNLTIDVARYVYEQSIMFADYAANHRRLFGIENYDKPVLVYIDGEMRNMTYAKAIEKYGDKKLFAEIHTNARYDRKQPVKVFIF